jgi:hypothetical protein
MKISKDKTVSKQWWRSFNGFDIFVILGGLVNLFVIGFLLGYWLLH